MDVQALAGTLPKDPRLACRARPSFACRLASTFPQQGSLLIEGKESGQPAVMAR